MTETEELIQRARKDMQPSLNWLNEANNGDERTKQLERLMEKYYVRLNALADRENSYFVRDFINRMREQELDRLRVLEVDLLAKEEQLIEREEKLAALCRKLDIPVTVYNQISERDVIVLYKKWRNYPKVAKKLEMEENQVREVVLMWRKKAQHRHEITAVFTKRQTFHDNDY